MPLQTLGHMHTNKSNKSSLGGRKERLTQSKHSKGPLSGGQTGWVGDAQITPCFVASLPVEESLKEVLESRKHRGSDLASRWRYRKGILIAAQDSLIGKLNCRKCWLAPKPQRKGLHGENVIGTLGPDRHQTDLRNLEKIQFTCKGR